MSTPGPCRGWWPLWSGPGRPASSQEVLQGPGSPCCSVSRLRGLSWSQYRTDHCPSCLQLPRVGPQSVGRLGSECCTWAQALRVPGAQAFARPSLEQAAPRAAPPAPQVVLALEHRKFSEASRVMTLIWGGGKLWNRWSHLELTGGTGKESSAGRRVARGWGEKATSQGQKALEVLPQCLGLESGPGLLGVERPAHRAEHGSEERTRGHGRRVGACSAPGAERHTLPGAQQQGWPWAQFWAGMGTAQMTSPRPCADLPTIRPICF